MKAFAILSVSLLLLVVAIPAAALAIENSHRSCHAKMECCHHSSKHGSSTPKNCGGKSCSFPGGCSFCTWNLSPSSHLDFISPVLVMTRNIPAGGQPSSRTGESWQPPERV